jgi:hypothetical protein
MKLKAHPKWSPAWSTSLQCSTPPEGAKLIEVKEIAGRDHNTESIQIILKDENNTWSASFCFPDNNLQDKLRDLLKARIGQTKKEIENTEVKDDFTTT